MVLAVTVLTDGFAARSLKIDGSRVEKDEIDLREEIPVSIEEPFLDFILRATGDRRQFTGFAGGCPEPCHGPVEVMKIERLGSWQTKIFTPRFRRPVASGTEESMQDGEIDGSLHIELKVSVGQQFSKNGLDPRFLPKAGEDEIGSDSGELCWLDLSRFMRIENREFVREAQT